MLAAPKVVLQDAALSLPLSVLARFCEFLYCPPSYKQTYRATFLLKATEEKINECKHGLVDGAVRDREGERERDGVTISPHQRLGPHPGGSTLSGSLLG